MSLLSDLLPKKPAERVLSYLRTEYQTYSDAALALFRLMERYPRKPEIRQNLFVVGFSRFGVYKCKRKAKSLNSLSPEQWERESSKMMRVVRNWSGHVLLMESEVEAGRFLLKKLDELNKIKRITACALILLNVSPFTPVPIDLTIHDPEAVEQAGNQSYVLLRSLQFLELLKENRGEFTMDMAAMLARQLEGLSFNERTALLGYAFMKFRESEEEYADDESQEEDTED